MVVECSTIFTRPGLKYFPHLIQSKGVRHLETYHPTWFQICALWIMRGHKFTNAGNITQTAVTNTGNTVHLACTDTQWIQDNIYLVSACINWISHRNIILYTAYAMSLSLFLQTCIPTWSLSTCTCITCETNNFSMQGKPGIKNLICFRKWNGSSSNHLLFCQKCKDEITTFHYRCTVQQAIRMLWTCSSQTNHLRDKNVSSFHIFGCNHTSYPIQETITDKSKLYRTTITGSHPCTRLPHVTIFKTIHVHIWVGWAR